MGTVYVSITLTVAVISTISVFIKSDLLKKASYIELPNELEDMEFKYAKRMKVVEIIGYTYLILITTLLLTLAEGAYEIVVFSMFMVLPLVVMLYRIMSWDKEIIKWRCGKLLYERGLIIPKKIVIDLDRIDRIEISSLHLNVCMRSRSEKIIKIPLVFENQALMYKILKEYRK